MTFEELSWFVDDTIKSELQGRPGVGQVDRYGGADREIRVDLDPDPARRLRRQRRDSVSQQIRRHQLEPGRRPQRDRLGRAGDPPPGRPGRRRPAGRHHHRAALGAAGALDQLGPVTDTFEELRSFARFNGQDVVVFAVFRAQGASEVSVQEEVEAASRPSAPRTRASPSTWWSTSSTRPTATTRRRSRR